MIIFLNVTWYVHITHINSIIISPSPPLGHLLFYKIDLTISHYLYFVFLFIYTSCLSYKRNHSLRSDLEVSHDYDYNLILVNFLGFLSDYGRKTDHLERTWTMTLKYKKSLRSILVDIKIIIVT